MSRSKTLRTVMIGVVALAMAPSGAATAGPAVQKDDRSNQHISSAREKPGASSGLRMGAEKNYGRRVPFPSMGDWRGTTYRYFCHGDDCRSSALFEWIGDRLYVRDVKRDGLSAIVYWTLNYNGRHGFCVNRFHKGVTVMCDKNFNDSELLNTISFCAGWYNDDTGIYRWTRGKAVSVQTGFMVQEYAQCPWEGW
jgi:hypothetical protein